MQPFIGILVYFSLLVASFQIAVAQSPLALAGGASSADELASKSLESPKPFTSEAIVNAFVTGETKLREALNQYTFKRDVVLQTIGANGEVTGQYIRNSQFLFDDKGNRIERVVYRPPSTLRGMRITKEDIQDLEGAQLLGIDVTEAGKYRFEYVGPENDATGQLFAIDVKPVQKPDPHRMRERYFVGRIWIDATTLQVVKVQGRVEPQGKQRFPVFETYREAAGEFFFPRLTKADDILRFPEYEVHYRVQVRYYDYKRFASKLTITDIEAPPE
jgi:hypothetical protein